MVHPICLLCYFLYCSHQSFRMFGDLHSIPQRSPDYERDNEMSYIDSFEHSLSSSGKVRFSESFCVCFISLFCFSLIFLHCVVQYLMVSTFFFLRRMCHPGGRDILMMHCLSFFEKRLLLITIFLESEKIFCLFICTFFFFFCSRIKPFLLLVLFLGCKIAQG